MNQRKVARTSASQRLSVGDANEEEKKILLLPVVDQKQDEQCEGWPAAQMVFFSTVGDKRIHLPAQDGTW